ncbi:MAG: hypothetical protein ACE5HQ_08765 [Gemmatimonadota bacterium]
MPNDSMVGSRAPAGVSKFDCAREGAVAGLYGGLSLILVYLIVDLLRLRPLGTPAFLSHAMFGQPAGAAGPADAGLLGLLEHLAVVVRDLTLYTSLHLTAFVCVGIGAAFLFLRARLPLNLLTGALYGAAVGSAAFYGTLGLVAHGWNAAPGWRLGLAANGLAGIIMVAHLAGSRSPPN